MAATGFYGSGSSITEINEAARAVSKTVGDIQAVVIAAEAGDGLADAAGLITAMQALKQSLDDDKTPL